MHQSLSDSSEDLYSLTSTTTNIFDFTTDTYVGGESLSVNPSKNRILSLINSFFATIRASLIWLIKLSFEFSLFVAYSLVYLRTKIGNFISFLDVSKDKLVSTLMWRRGLLFRPATHGGVVIVAVLAVIIGGLFSRGQIVAQDLTASEAVLKSNNTSQTIIPAGRQRSDILSYKVASGDTLSTLAAKFNVSVETIKWANNISADSDTLQPSQNLSIPPVTGVVYKVKAGDTLETVAKAYSADKQTIVDFPFNYIDDTLSLKTGQTLYVPNGIVPRPAAPKSSHPVYANYPQNGFVVGSGMLSWPVPAHISQYFSWYHTAIDIADPYGTPIYAAASGTVVDAKKQTTSFGWYCIIDSGNGYTEAYAHMSDLACSLGEHFDRGQYVGAIGMTGRTTGPHLHFEVHHNGTPVDPLTLLK
jgi:murein DD-endopeptidase MepM/ murein hydrolase activator NlpD